MQIYDLLVVISVLSLGLIPYLIVSKFVKFRIEFFDSLLIIIVFSFSLICFPLIFLGTNDFPDLFKIYIIFLNMLSLLFIIYFIFRNLPNIFRIINYYELEDTTTYRVIIILFFIALITYFFHAWILPLRGYDALTLYFPNALLISLTNHIPPFNPLNFYPVIKEPLNSLIYAYSIDLVHFISVDLVILTIIFLWALVTYQLTLLFFPQKKNLAFLSFIMFFFFPLNLWILDQWFYYQDIFLGFFFTLTIYFSFKSFDSSNSKSQTYFYATLASLSFSLSLISKASAWALFFILIALFLFYSDHQTLTKVYYISFFFILALFGITNLYILIVVVFLILLIIVLYHAGANNSFPSQFRSNKSSLLLIFGTVLILGGYWFYYTLYKFSFVLSPIATNLFKFHIFLFSSPTDISLSTIAFTFESAHRANFYSLIFVLFIGNLFAAFWALPKFLTLLKRSSLSFLVIWIILFFSIWLIFGSISIRYLTPLISPIIILTVYGFLLIKTKLADLQQINNLQMNNTENGIEESFSPVWIVFIVALGLGSLYFPVPLSTFSSLNRYAIAEAYLKSAYFYYSNWFLDLCILILLPIVIYYILRKRKFTIKMPSWNHSFTHKFKKASFSVLVLFIFIFPNFVLFEAYSSSNFNVSATQQLYMYDSRPQVQDLINVIYSLNSPTSIIMVYDTPGLPIWVGNPTYDIYYAKDVLKPLFASDNITEGLQILLNPYQYLASVAHYILPSNIAYPKLDFIVVPNFGNLYFSSFMNEFRDQNYFFGMVQNPHYYRMIYNNSDFLLFQRSFSNPSYAGIYDLGLQFNQTQIPILGLTPQYTNLGSFLSYYAKFYFLHNNIHTLNATIRTSLTANGSLKMFNDSLALTNITTDQFTLSWPIPSLSSFDLNNISISMIATDFHNTTHYYSWFFSSKSPLNVIKNKDNLYTLYSNNGMTYNS